MSDQDAEEDVIEPDGYYTGRWSVFEHQCLRCGKHMATVCPEPDTPTLALCSACIAHKLDQAREAEQHA